jgi:hypothetical protein
MARKKKEAAVLELEAPVLETAPLLDAVIENTPKQKPKPDIPPGYEVLPDDEYLMRINREFLGGASNKAAGLEPSGGKSEMLVKDVKVFGECCLVAVKGQYVCGGTTGSVRLRIPRGTIVAVKR